jgi:hypothetical protein
MGNVGNVGKIGSNDTNIRYGIEITIFAGAINIRLKPI